MIVHDIAVAAVVVVCTSLKISVVVVVVVVGRMDKMHLECNILLLLDDL